MTYRDTSGERLCWLRHICKTACQVEASSVLCTNTSLVQNSIKGCQVWNPKTDHVTVAQSVKIIKRSTTLQRRKAEESVIFKQMIEWDDLVLEP
ncbi:hypothetical protein KM043_018767 [Ampulex compressa]|nr:hypothetical protein KM043_018767 [Ampulex compressa]